MKEYPLEKMLNSLDRTLFGKRDCCGPGCDPCGHDLWPGVGQCCVAPMTYGPVAPSAPPALLDPEALRQHGEERINPFQDDPDQPPRPPTAPMRSGLRGVRAQPAAQRYVR
jgi:hypothetical protein